MEEGGITVTNVSSLHGLNIAEHVLGLFLMLTRRLDEGIRRQERNEWLHFQAFSEFEESRVCIVGPGDLSQAIV